MQACYYHCFTSNIVMYGVWGTFYGLAVRSAQGVANPQQKTIFTYIVRHRGHQCLLLSLIKLQFLSKSTVRGRSHGNAADFLHRQTCTQSHFAADLRQICCCGFRKSVSIFLNPQFQILLCIFSKICYTANFDFPMKTNGKKSTKNLQHKRNINSHSVSPKSSLQVNSCADIVQIFFLHHIFI